MRQAIADLPGSKIREVSGTRPLRGDTLAFWLGESDEVTPPEIREAAMASLRRGETFYSHNLGLAELREAIAAYLGALHRPIDVDRVVVTHSGVTALMIATQLLVDPGVAVVAVTPVWPNLNAHPLILGTHLKRFALRSVAGEFTLDLDALVATVTADTRALLVNAPNNPTGWVLTRADQQVILDHCRRTGTWIIADEVYERMFFGDAMTAPSVLDISTQDDRLLVVHGFSKSFLMTGWRLGWLVVPRGCLDPVGKPTEYNSLCAPVFVQRGGIAALALAETFVPALRARLCDCRDRLVAGLLRLPGVQVANPRGGLFAFLHVDGHDGSVALARELHSRHGLGLAPGAAFGPEGEGWLRWCFASRAAERLDAGLDRLARALARA